MLNAELFTRWFAPLRPLEISESSLVLGVPNDFSRIWLQENFLPLIRETVSRCAGQPIQVSLVVADTATVVPTQAETPVSKGATAPRASASSRLNPRYTFDSFVIGPNNDHALAAATAVAQSPARAYNPLFIYGGVGLGKTHLMQAIGHAVTAHGKNRRVCYITCEEFTNDFIHAIQNSTLTKFRKRFRHVDVLLIDDIQFLAGKERMQEEFFHTFNSLFDAHKQIVLSSDRPAAEIANLEARLVSRFEWGLVTDLQPPALETRFAILKKKAEALKLKLPDALLEFIAARIKTNIRRLEGALVRVASYVSFTGRPVTVEAAAVLLRDVLQEEARRTVSVDSIQRRVAEHFDIRFADMTSHRRPREVAFPRQVAMYLSRTLTEKSLVEIGELFGGRDHGTVLHACRLIEKKIADDESLKQSISFLSDAVVREQSV
jgi:chromosomal replication initiator protein